MQRLLPPPPVLLLGHLRQAGSAGSGIRVATSRAGSGNMAVRGALNASTTVQGSSLALLGIPDERRDPPGPPPAAALCIHFQWRTTRPKTDSDSTHKVHCQQLVGWVQVDPSKQQVQALGNLAGGHVPAGTHYRDRGRPGSGGVQPESRRQLAATQAAGCRQRRHRSSSHRRLTTDKKRPGSSL